MCLDAAQELREPLLSPVGVQDRAASKGVNK